MIELNLEKFTPKVQDAINFLAPYFEINKKQLLSFPSATIKHSQKNYPYYDRLENAFFFRRKDLERREVIGHEVGHYLHFHLNPNFWNDGISLNKWKTLLEKCVAFYAEKIYNNKGDPLKRPIINLSTLARKEYDFYSNKYSQGKLKSLVIKLELTGILKSLNIN